ncbi:uncharacterized protein LOC111336948 [Stylophora pistillata]|nr:uncharacterized protein LOC111336948 [Stylophora pistillata]
MSVDRDIAMAKIIDGHYDNLRQLLREIEFITSSDVDSEDGRRRSSEDQVKKSQIVCPEVYKGSTYGYPFYRKGFQTEECSVKRDINELVTLIFDEVVLTTETGDQMGDFTHTGRMNRFFTFLESVYRLHQGIRAHFILGRSWNQHEIDTLRGNLTFDLRTKISIQSLRNYAFSKGELLQHIIDDIKTQYILIAPSLTRFTNDINLERLLRVLSTHENTLFAGGSVRNRTGHWSHGCLQTQLKNYTLTYKSGYYRSFSECLVCDFISGPFMAKTSVLKEFGFQSRGDGGIFQELFLRVKDRFFNSHLGLGHSRTSVVSCPDVMFHWQPFPVLDKDLVNFAKKHSIKKIVEADGKVRWFGCRRAVKHREGEKCPSRSGFVVPPCCLENLADAIKFVMEQCERNNITCELQEGTLLGAVKFNKVLPWERDADIAFLTADFPRIVKIKDAFTRQRYVVREIKKPWCCVEGFQAGGKIELLADGWSIQMYGQHRMNPRELLANEHLPTKVLFSGNWLSAPCNPGLYVRHRYGQEVYRHAEHWLSTGKQSGWDAYETKVFSSCPVKGFHGCLDQYESDGSIQFDN